MGIRNSKDLDDIVGGIMALFILVFFWLLSAIVGIWTWPYTINTWLVFLGKTAVVTGWHGFFLGLVPFVGKIKFSLTLAVLTWIFMLFLVQS